MVAASLGAPRGWTRNIRCDPGEERNLLAERPEDAARLARLLDRRQEEALRFRSLYPPGEEAAPSAEEAREIEGLGYAGDEDDG